MDMLKMFRIEMMVTSNYSPSNNDRDSKTFLAATPRKKRRRRSEGKARGSEASRSI
jgi:hypothetical protein